MTEQATPIQMHLLNECYIDISLFDNKSFLVDIPEIAIGNKRRDREVIQYSYDEQSEYAIKTTTNEPDIEYKYKCSNYESFVVCVVNLIKQLGKDSGISVFCFEGNYITIEHLYNFIFDDMSKNEEVKKMHLELNQAFENIVDFSDISVDYSFMLGDMIREGKRN